jgi:AbrB family looped-hinge helix DNA binding protein
MSTVTVSSKYQIVIPAEIRKALKIKKGQKLNLVNMGGSIHLVPDMDIREMYGIFPGLSLEGIRDETDREF